MYFGAAFYMVPRLCGVRLWSERLAVWTAIAWNIMFLGAVVSLAPASRRAASTPS